MILIQQSLLMLIMKKVLAHVRTWCRKWGFETVSDGGRVCSWTLWQAITKPLGWYWTFPSHSYYCQALFAQGHQNFIFPLEKMQCLWVRKRLRLVLMAFLSLWPRRLCDILMNKGWELYRFPFLWLWPHCFLNRTSVNLLVHSSIFIFHSIGHLLIKFLSLSGVLWGGKSAFFKARLRCQLLESCCFSHHSHTSALLEFCWFHL